MEINTWILIIGGVAVLFFGYFFGLIEGRGQGYKKRQDEEKTEEKAGEIPTQPTAAPPVIQPERPSVLRLREEAGRLKLELDGTELDDGNLSPEQRRRLVEAVTRLRPWVETPVKASAPDVAPAPSAPRPVSAAPLPVIPLAEEPVANSMVGQISVILGQVIEGTTLAERGIKLLEDPRGGVTVVVGEERYASIGEVTDPQIQAALRAAIARWEKKYTPGL